MVAPFRRLRRRAPPAGAVRHGARRPDTATGRASRIRAPFLGPNAKRGTEHSMISATFPYHKQRRQVLGREMAYVDEGQGDPIVLLHGNPTSSYIWRNILPHLDGWGRRIAPDLIGMGDSAKLPESGPGSYTFLEHRRYLDALLELLGVTERVTFVVHDWGSTLGFDWAGRHPEAVRGLAYLEAMVKPYTWGEYPETGRQIFRALRSPAGEQLVLEQNSFIEVNRPRTVQRTLTQEELTEYRRPFAEPGEGRRPMLTFARQLPIDGDPVEVTEIVSAYGVWLSESPIPKLYIQGDPGLLQPSQHAFCSAWPAQSTARVRGLHNLQEDSPDEIGRALATWIATLPEPA